MVGHHADVIPGQSIRLYGVETNRYGGPKAYDITFGVGDTVIEHSYNLTYFGTITAIGAKTVTIKSELGRTVRQDFATFSGRNRDLDLARESKRNAEWMD